MKIILEKEININRYTNQKKIKRKVIPHSEIPSLQIFLHKEESKQKDPSPQTKISIPHSKNKNLTINIIKASKYQWSKDHSPIKKLIQKYPKPKLGMPPHVPCPIGKKFQYK